MTAIRDTLCKLRPVEIPRPKCAGLQFVSTRGRLGFYQSIKRDGEKYGIQIKNQGPRRPSLPDPWINKNNNESDPNSNYCKSRPQSSPNVNRSDSVPDNLSFASTSLNGAQKITQSKIHSHVSDLNGNYQNTHYQQKTQAVIPEEPEDEFFDEPQPDYEEEGESKNENAIRTYQADRIARPISNPPSAPPLLDLNFKKSFPKIATNQKTTILATTENNKHNNYKKVFDLTNGLQKSNFYLRQCQDLCNQTENLKLDNNRVIKTKF